MSAVDYEYQTIFEKEQYFRKNIYDPAYTNDSINTDLYYDLVKINKDTLDVGKTIDDNLLFNHKPLKITTESPNVEVVTEPSKVVVVNESPNIEVVTTIGNNLPFTNSAPQTTTETPKVSVTKKAQTLDDVKKIIELSPDHIFVAGGYIFSYIFGTPVKDIDIFLYGLTPVEATETINKIGNYLHTDMYNKNFNFYIARSKNALTFTVYNKYNKLLVAEYQIILRLYKSPSEILHGFDLDCCCLGYNGINIFATNRALFSIKHGYNTVNFDRLSPSYEYRLSKYGMRGVAIKIPNFDRHSVKMYDLYERLLTFITTKHDLCNTNDPNLNLNIRSYSPLSKKSNKDDIPLKGLDILLYLELIYRHNNWSNTGLEIIQKREGDNSDYTIQSIHTYNTNSIADLIDYIVDDDDNKHIDVLNELDIHFATIKDKIKKASPVKSFTSPEQTKSNVTESPPEDIELTEYECELKKIMYLTTTNLYYNKFIFLRAYINGKNEGKNLKPSFSESLDGILDFPENVYNALNMIRRWDIPAKIEYKITNPGEQATGTFHQTILENNNVWYGSYYKL